MQIKTGRLNVSETASSALKNIAVRGEISQQPIILSRTDFQCLSIIE